MRSAAPRLLTGLLLGLLGCTPEPVLVCADEAHVLETDGNRELTCGSVMTVRRYVEWLGGRPVAAQDKAAMTEALTQAWKTSPAAVEALVAEVGPVLETVATQRGLEAGEARSRAGYAALSGEGPLAAAPQAVRTVARRAVTPWASSDEDGLVLSEMDVEAWIFYASLCREAQGGGPLRMSVAQRQTAYNALVERFKDGPTADRIAMASLGVGWADVGPRWQGASYERQQGWINAAPLPPPMSASSLGYFQAVLDGDLQAHVSLLDQKMGPLTWLGAQ